MFWVGILFRHPASPQRTVSFTSAYSDHMPLLFFIRNFQYCQLAGLLSSSNILSSNLQVRIHFPHHKFHFQFWKYGYHSHVARAGVTWIFPKTCSKTYSAWRHWDTGPKHMFFYTFYFQKDISSSSAKSLFAYFVYRFTLFVLVNFYVNSSL